MIPIKGFIETSFLDWDGKLSSVIFLPGCNFRCPYCQNYPIILAPEELPDIPFEGVEKFLNEHKGWIDGVVISGGEPTIYAELTELIQKIKRLGFLVKLDTNGSNPEMLKELIGQKLIDYVAMDINAPLDKRYSPASGVEVVLDKIKESIQILMNSDIGYEFRTTVVPTFLGEEEIVEIARSIAGAKKYVLQQFNPRQTLDPRLEIIEPYSKKEMEKMVNLAKDYVQTASLRGV